LFEARDVASEKIRLDLKSVKVGRSEMMREEISKGRVSMSKTTRGKSNVNMRLGE